MSTNWGLSTLAVLAAGLGFLGCGDSSSGGGGAPPTGSPVIRISSTATSDTIAVIEFDAVENGPNPASKSFTVSNSGTGTLSWTASDDAPWLTVSPSSGVNTGSVTLSVDTSLLTNGFYSATVTISDPASLNGTNTLDVFLSLLPPGQALGAAAELRPDLFTGASVPSVSLQDGLFHPYQLPGVEGTTYDVTIDTTPSGQDITVTIREVLQGGQVFLVPQSVTTPFSTSFTTNRNARIELCVFDHNQAGLTLSTLTVSPASQPFSSTGFDLNLHVCGDAPFTGALGDPLGYHNDLATAGDRQAFAADLRNRINTLFAPTGIQLGTVTVFHHTNSDVTAVAPAAVANGRTRLPEKDSDRNQLANLGVAAPDKALDLFVMHSPGFGFEGVTGFCDCVPGGSSNLGGIFVGRGPEHSLFIRLFNGFNGQPDDFQPRTLDEVSSTLGHELGHFLSLYHVQETSGSPDDLPDTSNDPNNVMFPQAGNKTAWTQDQINAMRGFLAIRDH